MIITGQETINIMECARITANEVLRVQTAPIIGLIIISALLYVAVLLFLYQNSKYNKYLRQKGLLQDYTLWEFKRKEEKR